MVNVPLEESEETGGVAGGSEPERSAWRRIPRITIGRILVALVPISAYLSLAREIVKGAPGESPVAMSAIALLVSLSGFAVAAYRRATFPESMIQMTTTPLALLSIWQSFERIPVLEYRPVVAWSWLIVVGAALIRFFVVARRRQGPEPGPAPPPGLAILVADSIAAGLAHLGLLLIFVSCCMSTLLQS